MGCWTYSDFSWISDAASKDSAIIDIIVHYRIETGFIIIDQSLLKLLLPLFESLKDQNAQASPIF